jgi:nicotinate-nucleotide pyrophosphorylase (carboxylating)
MTNTPLITQALIDQQIAMAILEDVGEQDLTATLIPKETTATATLITREDAVLCGSDWFDSVFKHIDSDITINWQASDGDRLKANQEICKLEGSARSLLTGERTAMNFLQTLSATATQAAQYADIVADLPVKVLDTRKTLPGYRLAQKYATRCGGCHNHRIGLYDGVLIKENHIQAAGSISAAVKQAKQAFPDIAIEVEVESLDELSQAITARADIVLLDNFTTQMMREAVDFNQGQCQLEASGGITLDTLRAIAETGVDRISVGQITKDIQAIDLSLRFQ